MEKWDWSGDANKSRRVSLVESNAVRTNVIVKSTIIHESNRSEEFEPLEESRWGVDSTLGVKLSRIL